MTSRYDPSPAVRHPAREGSHPRKGPPPLRARAEQRNRVYATVLPDPVPGADQSPRARRLGDFHGDYVRSLRVLAWARTVAGPVAARPEARRRPDASQGA